jgi:hypothetical protein
MPTEASKLRDNILKERRWGHTTFQVTSRLKAAHKDEPVTSLLDGFIETLGFAGLDDGWKEWNSPTNMDIRTRET